MGAGQQYQTWSDEDKQQNYRDRHPDMDTYVGPVNELDYYGRPREHVGKPYWAGAYQLGQDPNEANKLGQLYRDYANQADLRETPKADYGFANQSRGMQLGSLALLRSAAHGGQPSAADAQYRLNMNQAGGAAGYGLAGGGSPLAMANAQRAGAGIGAQGMTAAGIQAANMRSAEDQRAMEAYTQGGIGMRGQDLQQSAYDADAALRGRTMNDQRALGYMGLRDQAYEAQRDAYLREQANLARYHAVMSGQEQARRQKQREQELAIAQTAGAVGGGMFSGAAAAGAFK